MQDLETAGNAISDFKLVQIRQPTQISSDDLPVCIVLDEADADDLEEITPHEDEYTSRYRFSVVLMFKDDCPVTDMLSIKDSFITKIYTNSKAGVYPPFRLESYRQYPGHWGAVQGRFITIDLSRQILEDFSS